RADMEMLDLPVRHQQALLVVEISMTISHAIAMALNDRAVVGMDPLHDDIERRLDVTLDAHDVVCFLRPIDFAGGDLPAEASGESELLRLRQIGLAALQGLRSEEHTSELQSQSNLVCRLLLEKKKQK